MEYFTILGVATALIVVLALLLYRRRRDVGLLVGLAALYYWSLYGAWYIVIDKTGGYSGKRYHYLELKMFPLDLDGNYLVALVLYAGFLAVVELTLFMALSQKRERPIPRLVLRHEPILIPAMLAGLASFLIVRDHLSAAWALNTSAYLYTRSQPYAWFTLHQVLNRVALIPPAIGLATLVAGDRSRFFVSRPLRYTWLGYAALFAGMGVFTFVLGNKNEVLVAMVAGVLAYVASVKRPKLLRLGLVVAGGVWFLYGIDYFRGTPLTGLGDAVATQIEGTNGVGEFLSSSNEAFAAHFSMYGVLASGVEPRFGYSLYWLACSVIPRLLWPERPPDIYDYYREQVGTTGDQGYTLHHATGWYLNFGLAGVPLGAVVLGLVWAWCLNAHQRIRPGTRLPARLLATVAPWVWVANLPPLIRAGPEGYKGFLLEGVMIPVAVLLLACRPPKRRVRHTLPGVPSGMGQFPGQVLTPEGMSR